MLEDSFSVQASHECPAESRLDFLGNQVFNFCTYDGSMSEILAEKAIEVCEAISQRKTFEYIKDQEDYLWFLIMCNMPFFACRIEWGTSIRGAWWKPAPLESCGLYQGWDQILKLEFTDQQWLDFVSAMIQFAHPERKPNE